MKIRFFLKALFVLLAIWLLLVGGLWLFQRFLIFQGTPLPQDHVFQFEVPFEEQFLFTDDSLRLNALYFSARSKPQGVVLYFHGNADNLQRWGRVHQDFLPRGYDLFMIDYRGYGKSEGAPEEQAYYRDAHLAYTHLTRQFPAHQIIIYGRSLGSSIASKLATQVPAKMLILETPFDRLEHVPNRTLASMVLPFGLKYKLASDRHLPKVLYPVHIFHGTRDELVPLRSAEGLRPVLTEGDSFTIIPGGGHRNLTDFPKFQQGLDKLLGVRRDTTGF